MDKNWNVNGFLPPCNAPCQMHLTLTVKWLYSENVCNLEELHHHHHHPKKNKKFLGRAVTINILLQCILTGLLRNTMQSLGTEMFRTHEILSHPWEIKVSHNCVYSRGTGWEPMTSPRVTKKCTLSHPLILSLRLLHIKSNPRLRSRCWLSAGTNGVEHVFVSF